jgi:hypothetical protein
MCTPVDVGDVEEPPRLAGGGRGARESQQQHRREAGPPQRSHSLRPHYGVSGVPPPSGLSRLARRRRPGPVHVPEQNVQAVDRSGFAGEKEKAFLGSRPAVDINLRGFRNCFLIRTKAFPKQFGTWCVSWATAKKPSVGRLYGGVVGVDGRELQAW